MLRNQPCTGVLCFQDAPHSTDEEAETFGWVFRTILRRGRSHQAAREPPEGTQPARPCAKGPMSSSARRGLSSRWGTDWASAGILPVFPRPHLHAAKLNGILVGSRVSGTLCLGLAPPFSPESLPLALITDLEQLSVRLMVLSEESPGPLTVWGSISPLKWL